MLMQTFTWSRLEVAMLENFASKTHWRLTWFQYNLVSWRYMSMSCCCHLESFGIGKGILNWIGRFWSDDSNGVNAIPIATTDGNLLVTSESENIYLKTVFFSLPLLKLSVLISVSEHLWILVSYFFSIIRKCPPHGCTVGVIKHTIAWDRHWGGDVILEYI